METFNNHLCYVILFENHQHGGTHGMTNRLTGVHKTKKVGKHCFKVQLKISPTNVALRRLRETHVSSKITCTFLV